MGADGSDATTDIELIAKTLQAIANSHRLALLLGLANGRARSDLVDELTISESGVSNHLRTLADAGLIYRTEDGWQVSPFGTFFATFIDAHGDVVADARRRIAKAEKEAESEYEDVQLPEQERERSVEWRTWELVRAELEDLLADQMDHSSENIHEREESGE